MSNPVPPPPLGAAAPAAQPQKKKGLPLLGWIAIGCGVVLLFVGIGVTAVGWFAVSKVKEVAQEFEKNPEKAAAEMFVKLNPELELVESDGDAGTITVREKSSGTVSTFDYSELESGKFSFETEGGGTTVFDASEANESGVVTITTDEGQLQYGGAGEMPDWIPRHPDTVSSQQLVHQTTSTSETGNGGFVVDAEPDAVFAWYKDRMEAEGFDVTTTTIDTDGQWMGMISGRKDKTELAVNVTAEEGKTQATMTYSRRD